MKQIPNLITLLNLLMGCLAIVFITQAGLNFTIDANGENIIVIPEKIYLASICIALAALIDFFDGFIARLLGASSEMGKQLDSLSDTVSFGVAPGLIAYHFLRLSFAHQADGLSISMIYLLPAFLLPCAGAYRLARFNISTTQSQGFQGVPIPAVGLLFASFPLIYWYAETEWMIQLMLNKWFWYGIILIASYLMVSSLPMLALKFTNFHFSKMIPFLLIGLVALVTALIFGWISVPITFFAYVILSLLFKNIENDLSSTD